MGKKNKKGNKRNINKANQLPSNTAEEKHNPSDGSVVKDVLVETIIQSISENQNIAQDTDLDNPSNDIDVEYKKQNFTEEDKVAFDITGKVTSSDQPVIDRVMEMNTTPVSWTERSVMEEIEVEQMNGSVLEPKSTTNVVTEISEKIGKPNALLDIKNEVQCSLSTDLLSSQGDETASKNMVNIVGMKDKNSDMKNDAVADISCIGETDVFNEPCKDPNTAKRNNTQREVSKTVVIENNTGAINGGNEKIQDQVNEKSFQNIVNTSFECSVAQDQTDLETNHIEIGRSLETMKTVLNDQIQDMENSNKKERADNPTCLNDGFANKTTFVDGLEKQEKHLVTDPNNSFERSLSTVVDKLDSLVIENAENVKPLEINLPENPFKLKTNANNSDTDNIKNNDVNPKDGPNKVVINGKGNEIDKSDADEGNQATSSVEDKPNSSTQPNSKTKEAAPKDAPPPDLDTKTEPVKKKPSPFVKWFKNLFTRN